MEYLKHLRASFWKQWLIPASFGGMFIYILQLVYRALQFGNCKEK